MIKNKDCIQRFLDAAQEETEKSGESCTLLTFSDFWDRKYGADKSDFDKRSFLNDVGTLIAANQISYYQELTSYKKGIAPVVFFFKKIIRKINAFLFLPLVASQNTVNMSCARVSEHLRSFVNREEMVNVYRTKKEKEFAEQIENQRKMIDELTRTVNELNEKIDRLASGGSNQ